MKRNEFDMTRLRSIGTFISVGLILIATMSLSLRGLNWGQDFTGGVVTEVQLDHTVTAAELRPALAGSVADTVSVISAGEPGRWVLRYSPPEGGATQAQTEISVIQTALAGLSSELEVLKTEFVGPQVGEELVEQGGLALLMALVSILAYLSFRFEWRLASGALMALLHDVMLVLGLFALMQWEFDLTVFAAVLAVLGYSLNDSIIIADRIRSTLLSEPGRKINEISDMAIRATLSRTLITSGTTLATVACLWLLGGDSLQGFSTALFVGIIAGTWSSITLGTVVPDKLGLEAAHYQPVALDDRP
ncbi:Protein translocase subunit SecF [Sinobacterium norvegicum]|uniref:Protein-export membrane protein SecF n=1 Tax=Sinobacterium norvegicum TaxID=1641715 RepID=A0ABM9A9S8_9GAMM|nr:protein translocase subunit SecF [Sinobacterium norvegicum]CAH0989957.1 Protein translocase subunit SecF [Sinobacterium norvegicum]